MILFSVKCHSYSDPFIFLSGGKSTEKNILRKKYHYLPKNVVWVELKYLSKKNYLSKSKRVAYLKVLMSIE